MKILFVASGNVRSNFTHRVMALGKALHARGHDVAIIAPKADKYNNFVPEDISELDGVRVLQPFQFATKRLEINLLPYTLGAMRMVLREKPDLIYIYKPTPISVIGLVGKLFRGTQTVLDMDDLGSEVMKIEGHPTWQRKLVEWSEHLAARYASRIVVASSYLREQYRKNYPDKPLHMMPNGVESKWFDTPPTKSTEKKRIVFMGSLNRRTIIEPLFDVLPAIVKKHKDVRVLVMGDGQDLPYFKKKVAKLGLQKYVEFTGWLALEDAFKRLQSGDIGYNYMPDEVTVKAASNMKIPQYMARGVVPLVSDMGDLAFAVDNGKAGYVVPLSDHKALQADLLAALEDKDRSHKAMLARKYAKATFDWDALADKFNDWLDGKSPETTKRVFVVASDLPGDFGGAPIRNYQLVKQLAADPHLQVELFCTTQGDPIADAKKLEAELPIRAHVLAKKPSSLGTTLRALFIDHMQPFMTEYAASGLGAAVRQAAEERIPDAVQMEQTDAYFALRPHIAWLQQEKVKIVLDAHNVELDAFRGAVRTFPFAKKLVGRLLTPAFRDLEQEAVTSSDAVLACAKYDAEYFKQMRGDKKVYLVQNGVDCDHFSPVAKKKSPAHTLLFIGGTGYPANADAVRFYMNEVHPLVKTRVHDVRVLVIGASEAWAKDNGYAGDKTFVPLGFVDDIKPYLDQAAVGICPIREGSGTRLKVLTYMSAGLGVVSTRKGSEGISYTKGKQVTIADASADFAQGIVTLLTDAKKRDAMGKAGHEFVTQVYDWPVIGKTLRKLYNDRLL